MPVRNLILPLYVLFLCLNTVFSQSKVLVYGGLSLMYTENPLTNISDQTISGYHVGLGGRIGADRFFFSPGLELHVMQQQSSPTLDPFRDFPKIYLIKLPLQAGFHFIHKEPFSLRGMAGVAISFVTSIDENTLVLDSKSVKDAQYGLLFGAGVDIHALTVDVQFEKGISAFYTEKKYKADYVSISLGFSF